MKKVEKWSLGYAFLKPIVQLVHRLIYKEFHVIGRNNIPKDKPVIFAPNHQNGLMDDMVIVTTAPGQSVFLGRADIFKNWLIRAFLNFVKIIPIYRIRDGKDSLQKNAETFMRTIEILKSNTNICLYPEGAQVGKRSMLQHKKAIPRIVFMAHEKLDEAIDIQIVPVGLTFSKYYKFRRSLIVWYGEPISTKDYCELYDKEGERNATIALRERLHNEIASLIVNIPESEITDVYEGAFRLIRPEIYKQQNLKKNEVGALKADRYFTSKLHDAFEKNEKDKEIICAKQREFNQLLTQLKLKRTVVQYNKYPVSKSVFILIYAIITLPLTLVGTIVNGWLFYLTQYPHRKKIKDYTFWSTISFGAGLVGFLIYDIILWVIIAQFVPVWIAYFIVFGISLAGVLAWDVKEKLVELLNGIRYNRLQKSTNSAFQKMMQLKRELVNIYTKMLDSLEY